MNPARKVTLNLMKQILKVIGRLVKYLVIAGFALLLLALILLAGAYEELRGAAASGLAGKSALTAAVSAAQSQNWAEAESEAISARTNFAAGLNHLEQTKSNPAVRYAHPIRTQINDLEYLLKTAEILSRSLERVAPLFAQAESVRTGAISRNFNDLPVESKRQLLQQLYEAEPEIQGLKANLHLAILNLERIHRFGVLWPFYREISDIKNELIGTAAILDKISPLLKLLPALTGYPAESRFLLIFQNNDEIRPSGGFIGVYGLLEVKDGEIITLDTSDSYHLDMPAAASGRWRRDAPLPLQKYLKVENWYMRDSNWSPDWSIAARQIHEIYNGEKEAVGLPAEEFTGIIGITPDLVADLIDLVGPITVRGETYTSENFQPLLQYNVEIAYREQDIASWDRKNLVDEVMAVLKERLFHLSSEHWDELVDIIARRVATKSIQLYFPHPAWQALAVELGADGRVNRAESDYLMVVDANLAAFKSDAVVKKSYIYQLEEKETGVDATLVLNYKHEGGFDWRTTRYRSYTRVLVPRGSELISVTGLDDHNPDLSTAVDESLDKTVIGFFLTVEPGTARSFTVRYRLPDEIKDHINSGRYSLMAQRQSGQRVISFDFHFKPLRGRSQNWHSSLETDRLLRFGAR